MAAVNQPDSAADNFSKTPVPASAGTKTFTKDGDYTVTATYGEDAGFPADVELRVSEITNSQLLDTYTQQASSALENGAISSARFFDISFVSNGSEIEPKADVDVNIQITLSDSLKVDDGQTVQAVHFPESTAVQTPEVLPVGTQTDNTGAVQTVSFTQKSFSVTGVVVTGDKLSYEGWPTNDGEYVLLFSDNNLNYALKNDGSLMQVSVEGGKANFASSITKIDDLKDYLWQWTSAERTLSNNSSGGETVYVDPGEKTGVSSTKRQLYLSDENVIYSRNPRKYIGAERNGAKETLRTLSNSYYPYKASSVTFVNQFEADTDKPSQNPDNPSQLDEPAAVKKLSDNNDGTYNLSLSIKAQSKSTSETSKADVEVILNCSGSMSEKTDDGITRLKAAKNAIDKLTESLMSNNTAQNPDAVRMSLITFGDSAKVTKDWTTDKVEFKKSVDNLEEQKNVATNWEAALQQANTIQTRDGAEKYVIFISDGNPTYYVDGYTTGGTGYETDTNVATCYYFAKDDAYELVQNGYHFYTIGVFGDVSRMQNLTAYAYSGTDDGSYPDGHYQTASDQKSLVEAFQSIIDQITHNFGYQGVAFTDGLTSMTSTTLVDGAANQFRYDVTDASGNPVSLTANSNGTYSYTNSENIPKIFNGATFQNRVVSWSMDVSEDKPFELDNGYTYTVSFTVWPDQSAYDLAADLNNDIITYDKLSDDEKSQIKVGDDGIYRLKTNTDDTSVTYKTVTTITSSSGSTTTVGAEKTAKIENPEGIKLTGMPISIVKEWKDSIYPEHRPVSIVLRLVRDKGTDDEKDVDVSLSNVDGWEKKIYISPGLIVNGETLNTGHTYDIEEKAEDYHYDLETKTYNPMLIDSAEQIYDGTKKADTNKLSELKAVNNLRGSISLNKLILDADGNDITYLNSDGKTVNPAVSEESFTYHVTLESPNKYTDNDYWFTFFDQAGESHSYSMNPNSEDSAGKKQGNPDIISDYTLTVSDDGKTTVKATVSLKPGEEFRMINIPVGTKYILTEDAKDGYEVGDIITGNNTSAKVSVNDATISAITVANQNDTVTYKNKLTNAYSINLIKTDDSNHSLAGAEFTLKKGSGTDQSDAYTMDGKVVSSLTTGMEAVSIGDLPSGTYTLTETKAPEGYVKLSSPVTITVDRGKHVKVNEKDVNPDGNTFLINVSNARLYELPETGGSGIYWNVILGTLICMFFAYAAYSLRRKERRRRHAS